MPQHKIEDRFDFFKKSNKPSLTSIRKTKLIGLAGLLFFVTCISLSVFSNSQAVDIPGIMSFNELMTDKQTTQINNLKKELKVAIESIRNSTLYDGGKKGLLLNKTTGTITFESYQHNIDILVEKIINQSEDIQSIQDTFDMVNHYAWIDFKTKQKLAKVMDVRIAKLYRKIDLNIQKEYQESGHLNKLRLFSKEDYRWLNKKEFVEKYGRSWLAAHRIADDQNVKELLNQKKQLIVKVDGKPAYEDYNNIVFEQELNDFNNHLWGQFEYYFNSIEKGNDEF